MVGAPARSQRARAIDRLQTGNLVRLREFAADGISPETVARLVRDGVAVRQARGCIRRPTPGSALGICWPRLQPSRRKL